MTQPASQVAPRVLIDANVFLRQAQPLDPLHATANAALHKLTSAGDDLCIVPQTLYEFWAVATRPTTARGGLGWTPQQAERSLARLQLIYSWFPDSAVVFDEWRRLVASYIVSGLPSHDARLVAAMKVHGITHLLTFNDSDFRRFEAGEGIAVIDPANA